MKTNSVRSFYQLISYAKPWRPKIIWASFCSIMNKLFDIAPEILIGIYVDLVVQREQSFIARLGFESIESQITLLAIATFLIWLSKRKKFDGQIIWSYGILYSIGRFAIEYLRGDDRGFAIDQFLSTSQFVGVFVFILSLFMLLTLHRKKTDKVPIS